MKYPTCKFFIAALTCNIWGNLAFAAIILQSEPVVKEQGTAEPGTAQRLPSIRISPPKNAVAPDSEDLLRRAQAGETDAMLQLGYAYYMAGTSPQAMANARKWFKAAADSAESRAMLAYGYLLSQGYGGMRDVQQGRELLQRAQEQGLPRATYILSSLEASIPGSKKRAEARRLLERAATAGDVIAQNALGIEYELEGDISTAKHWYVKAINQGSDVALANFSRLERKSTGAKRSSIEKLKDGVADGDGIAMYELAMRYHKGDGLGRDYIEALKLYQKSADRGHKPAQEMVSLIMSRPSSDPKLPFSLSWMATLADRLPGGAEQNQNSTNVFELPRRYEDALSGLINVSTGQVDQNKNLQNK
ncbi:MAG: sel1 repeat family protein [Burkholderiaceae bacterium]|nr:sel1 repeat family protein [Burkholderiaceae bacterium]